MENVKEVPLNLTGEEADALADHLDATNNGSPHLSSIMDKLGQARGGGEA